MQWLQGWVFFDGDCLLCRNLAARFEKILTRRGFDLAPLQAPWAKECLDLDLSQPLVEMRLLTRDGRQLGGADAIIFLSRRIWWAWPLYALAQLPGVQPLLRAAYRWMAARRHCVGTCCAARRPHRWIGGVLLLVLPLLSLALRGRMPAWGFMWVMAFAIYAGCKWLTWWEARAKLRSVSFGRSLAYLFLWPGMDAVGFLDGRKTGRVMSREWLLAFSKILLGTLLFCGVAPRMQAPLLIGWIGLVGIIFVLHFGLFHLLALLFRSAGIPTRPVMRNPIRATSLGEFWGKRWNLAFHDLVTMLLFRPLLSVLSVTGATLATFLVSGLLHEMVISLPTGGGFGLPTGYFLLQGLGMLLERSPLGARIGLGKGIIGWLFTVLLTAGPVFWLFHPRFVEQVIVPFMEATGAR